MVRFLSVKIKINFNFFIKTSIMKKTALFTVLAFALAIVDFNANAVTTITLTKADTTANGTDLSTIPFQKLNTAVYEFKTLSKKEKRERVKEAKNEIRKFKAEKRAGAEPSTNTLLLVILALLLPPLAVYLHQGEINGKFWLSLLLTLLFFIPGVIYALIVVLGES